MSRISDLVGMRYAPVAIYRAPSLPEGAFVPEPNGCSLPTTFMMAAKKRRMCAVDKAHVGCHGVLSGYGFGGVPDIRKAAMKASVVPEEMQSTVGHGGSGKREFATQEIALVHMSPVPDYGDGSDAIVFEPYDDAVARGAPIEVVATLVNATELTALSLLAEYAKETPGPGTVIPYGHSCQQIYAIPRAEGESDDPHGVIGMTDIYVRKYLEPGELSFAAPAKLWKEMESNADSSFLTTERWRKAREREGFRWGPSSSRGRTTRTRSWDTASSSTASGPGASPRRGSARTCGRRTPPPRTRLGRRSDTTPRSSCGSAPNTSRNWTLAHRPRSFCGPCRRGSPGATWSCSTPPRTRR